MARAHYWGGRGEKMTFSLSKELVFKMWKQKHQTFHTKKKEEILKWNQREHRMGVGNRGFKKRAANSEKTFRIFLFKLQNI